MANQFPVKLRNEARVSAGEVHWHSQPAPHPQLIFLFFVGGSRGGVHRTAICGLVKSLRRSEKRTTCQLNCRQAAAGAPAERSGGGGEGGGGHYVAVDARERGVGRRGPLAMVQSLMPSICLNGFLNPSPPFHSSPSQTVFRLPSPAVINPFISKKIRSMLSGARAAMPREQGGGKTCGRVAQRSHYCDYSESGIINHTQNIIIRRNNICYLI